MEEQEEEHASLVCSLMTLLAIISFSKTVLWAPFLCLCDLVGCHNGHWWQPAKEGNHRVGPGVGYWTDFFLLIIFFTFLNYQIHGLFISSLSPRGWGCDFKCIIFKHDMEINIESSDKHYPGINAFMACCLFGAKHYLNQCWIIVKLYTNISDFLHKNDHIWIQENAFGNVIPKMATILTQPPCVDENRLNTDIIIME